MISIRLATSDDIAYLTALIDRSVRLLQAGDYTPAQIDSALKNVYGVDTQLIADGTYFVAEAAMTDKPPLTVGCGGWSKRKTLYGSDHCAGREDSLLDPAVDAAKIRAFFIDPDWSRKGIGTMILNSCEAAAMAAGFTRFEMGATLTGVALYRARGYEAAETINVRLEEDLTMPVVRMTKSRF